MASNALLDKTIVAGQGSNLQTSTTSTVMVSSLHGLFRPLRHLNLYFRPQAAPLSQIPSLAATNKPSPGNCSLLLPWHFVAAETSHRYSIFNHLPTVITLHAKDSKYFCIRTLRTHCFGRCSYVCACARERDANEAQ